MKSLKIVGLSILLLSACRKEQVQPLSQYESAEVQARAFNFQIYPGARLLEKQTDMLRRAHFILDPKATEAPPMAIYDTDAPLDKVAEFYGQKYGYQIADNQANDFKSVKPSAYYFVGDLAATTTAIKPVLDQLKIPADVSKATGSFKGAYFAPQVHLPRVSLQRPYFDPLESKMVDRTQIVLVKE